MWHDPPCITDALFQWYLQEPLRVGDDGSVAVPRGPGLGVALDEDKIAHYRI